MRKEIISILAFLALLMPSLALAMPEEAFGNVTNVIDGDTIDVLLQGHDNRIYEDTIRVRLADIDTPEMDTLNGPIAKQYTYQELQDKRVYLDLDNKTGKDTYGRWVAVVYLQMTNGTHENFNKILVDTGQACIWDFDNNEFDPAIWWDGNIPADACIKSSGSELSQPFIGPGSAWAGPGKSANAGLESQNYFSQETSNSVQQTSSDGPFVGSSKSDKYHYPSCPSAKRIKSSNLVTFSSSAEARAMGYVPCSKCSPP